MYANERCNGIERFFMLIKTFLSITNKIIISKEINKKFENDIDLVVEVLL